MPRVTQTRPRAAAVAAAPCAHRTRSAEIGWRNGALPLTTAPRVG